MFRRSPAGVAAIALLWFVSACNARDTQVVASAETSRVTSRDSVRLVVKSVVSIDSIVSVETGEVPRGAAYESRVAAAVLPGEMRNEISLAPRDTSTANYQAAAWWMGREDASPRRRWRFAAGFERFTSGVLVLRLDTLLDRHRQRSPFESASADSIAVRGLGKIERFAMRCRVAGYRADERILGVVADSTPERWMTPRLAWFVDTAASRFRRMKPDSLACWLDQSPD